MRYEQNMICEYIDEYISRFYNLTQIAYSTIDLLKERRTSLISSVVTGKIDLRDWQSP